MRVRTILAFFVLAASSLLAQTFRGTVLGTVTDASGAVVAGAKVAVRNVNTGQERTTETTADGSYSVPELPIGTYTVTITQSGFQTSVTNGVVVDVASERRVDAALKAGQVSQTVEVSGEELSQVETTSAQLGGTLTAETIANVPVNGRDYTKLIYLNPGVAGSPDQISDSPGSFGTFSMNGSRGRSNNFLLDGTDMNDGYRNDPAINEAGVFGDSGDDSADRCRRGIARALQLRSGIRPQQRRRRQHRDQERHQCLARIGAGVFAQRAFGARNYFNNDRTEESVPQQPVRRFARWADRQRQDILLSSTMKASARAERRQARAAFPIRHVIARRRPTREWGETLNPVTPALLAEIPGLLRISRVRVSDGTDAALTTTFRHRHLPEQRRQPDRQNRSQFQSQQPAHRALLLRRQHQPFLCFDGQRRSGAGLQHRTLRRGCNWFRFPT